MTAGSAQTSEIIRVQMDFFRHTCSGIYCFCKGSPWCEEHGHVYANGYCSACGLAK